MMNDEGFIKRASSFKFDGTDILTRQPNVPVKVDRLKPTINVETLAAARTLLVTDYMVQWLDAGGADRTVTLPAEASSTNLMFIILNASDGAGEDLVVKNDAATTIGTLGPGMSGIFSCDGTNWKWEDEVGIYYDKIAGGVVSSGYHTVGQAALNTTYPLYIVGNAYISSGVLTSFINSRTNNAASFSIGLDVTGADATDHAIKLQIDSNDIITAQAKGDGAGGIIGKRAIITGGISTSKVDAGAADYNPSILTSDYIITVDTTAAARSVIISAEDKATGSATSPRIFIIKDIAGNANANNITVSLETAGTIDGAATAVISVNYDSITLMIDGTNGYVI